LSILKYSNFANIDTAATAVMATYIYEKKDKIEFKIGGKTSVNGGSAAGMRMNSFWFRQFNMAPEPVLLPVKLVSFSAALNDNKAAIKWTTSSEKNVSHFSIEKSLDGQNFSEAGIVFAFGNSSATLNYTFIDKNINTDQTNLIYYRLRSADIDGNYELSNVRIVTIGKQNKQGITLLTYPNPVSNELRITIPITWQGKEVTYESVSNNGQVAIRNVAGSASQTEAINVNCLAPGFYVVKVICNGEMDQQKVIKL
jgi:hypothetical protein